MPNRDDEGGLDADHEKAVECIADKVGTRRLLHR